MDGFIVMGAAVLLLIWFSWRSSRSVKHKPLKPRIFWERIVMANDLILYEVPLPLVDPVDEHEVVMRTLRIDAVANDVVIGTPRIDVPYPKAAGLDPDAEPLLVDYGLSVVVMRDEETHDLHQVVRGLSAVQGDEVTLTLTQTDDAGNESLPRKHVFIATDAIPPATPADFVAVITGEVEGDDTPIPEDPDGETTDA